MEVEVGIPDLKRRLLEEVRLLVRSDGSAWKEPILQVLNELRRSNVHAVLFGGTLRSLLASRVFQGRFGRPRDVDVVVAGAQLAALEEQFRDVIERRTRFGGLHLRRGSWHFDVWPLGETWAFKKDQNISVAFEELPSTTTFNLEAIAVETWSSNGRPRALFSGNDQFFEGFLSRTLELNRADSPFPELTVVRAVVMATELRFKIGPQLGAYIANMGPRLNEESIAKIQVGHYGCQRLNSYILKQLIELISRHASRHGSMELPRMGQLHLWESDREHLPRIRIDSLKS